MATTTYLPNGNYVETTLSGSSATLYVQEYDSGGATIGPQHSYSGGLGVGALKVVPLSDQGYALGFDYATGSMIGGDNSTVVAFDAGSNQETETGFSNTTFDNLVSSPAGGFMMTGGDNLPPGLGGTEFDYNFARSGLFDLFDNSGAVLGGGELAGGPPTASVLSDGDLQLVWRDSGANGILHTLAIDPHNLPDLTQPAAPTYTAYDGATPITSATADTTPTIRVPVSQSGELEIAHSWYAITGADVAQGYKDVTLSLPVGQYTYSSEIRIESPIGIVSQPTALSLQIDTGANARTTTTLPDGSYVQNWVNNTDQTLYTQKYDSSGNTVGPLDSQTFGSSPESGNANEKIVPLSNGGYALALQSGFSATDVIAFDVAGQRVHQLTALFNTTLVNEIASPNGYFLVTAIAISSPSVGGQIDYNLAPPGVFALYDNAASLLGGGPVATDVAPAATVLSNGDYQLTWTDIGANGVSHTLDIDPNTLPDSSRPYPDLSQPAAPTYTAYDGATQITGPTSDTTPTIRVPVSQAGQIEIADTWYAVTSSDAAQGYKDITLSLNSGTYTYSSYLRLENASGIVSDPSALTLQIDTNGGGGTTGQTFTANNTPGQQLTGTPYNDIFYAGHNSVVMTGNGGDDTFIFQYLPWNAGQITDFTIGADKLDLSALLQASGYTGSDPVKDGYVILQSDGSGGTEVLFDPNGPSPNTIQYRITDLDNVSTGGLTWAQISGGSSGGTPGVTLTADDTPNQQLTGTPGNDIFYAGHNSVSMTGNGGADTFIFQYLPWNAGQITDFKPGTDKIDLSALFQASGYTGSDPVKDGYVILQSDGSGGTEVFFDPNGPAANTIQYRITDLDNVSSSGLTWAQISGGSSGGGTTGETLTANDTPNQQLTGTPGNDIFYAGHNSVSMTGNGGVDQFIFQYLPWNAGQITDFAPGTGDKLDLRPLFAAANYHGSDPVADGYLAFTSDGKGDTQVTFNPHDPNNPYNYLIVTLDHVAPGSVHTTDWMFQ